MLASGATAPSGTADERMRTMDIRRDGKCVLGSHVKRTGREDTHFLTGLAG